MHDDVIVEIIFDTIDQLENIVQNKIRKISKIQSTMTLIPFLSSSSDL